MNERFSSRSLTGRRTTGTPSDIYITEEGVLIRIHFTTHCSLCFLCSSRFEVTPRSFDTFSREQTSATATGWEVTGWKHGKPRTREGVSAFSAFHSNFRACLRDEVPPTSLTSTFAYHGSKRMKSLRIGNGFMDSISSVISWSWNKLPPASHREVRTINGWSG